MNPSPRIQKKYEQKNVLPARAILLSKVVSDFIQKLHKKKKKSFVENTV
jgi:hypothetical protein